MLRNQKRFKIPPLAMTPRTVDHLYLCWVNSAADTTV